MYVWSVQESILQNFTHIILRNAFNWLKRQQEVYSLSIQIVQLDPSKTLDAENILQGRKCCGLCQIVVYKHNILHMQIVVRTKLWPRKLMRGMLYDKQLLTYRNWISSTP